MARRIFRREDLFLIGKLTGESPESPLFCARERADAAPTSVINRIELVFDEVPDRDDDVPVRDVTFLFSVRIKLDRRFPVVIDDPSLILLDGRVCRRKRLEEEIDGTPSRHVVLCRAAGSGFGRDFRRNVQRYRGNFRRIPAASQDECQGQKQGRNKFLFHGSPL
jgi:hypothetical protein